MTKFERRKDKRLRQVYGRSLKWFNHQFKKQGGHCYCCDFVPHDDGVSLHVEHDHKLAALPVYVEQFAKNFYVAFTVEFGVVKEERTKVLALRRMRRWLRRKSVRGLVCWPCNTLIQKSYDQPDRLRKASEMLDRHQKKMHWRKYAA